MAIGNFPACLNEVLAHEGGFSNDPDDNGGMTNLGVTKRVYEAWVKYPVSEAVMRNLTPKLVTPLYRARYWDVLRGDSLPRGVDLCVFDFGVNGGTNRAARYLQRLVGIPPEQQDGIIGEDSMAHMAAYGRIHGWSELVKDYGNARRAYYRKLDDFPKYGKGWLRRVDDIEAAALGMIGV